MIFIWKYTAALNVLSIGTMNGIIERLGGVTEWLKVPLSKSGVALRLPWVRIPPPPLSGGTQTLWQLWRGAGVVDQARLESVCTFLVPWVRIPPSP